MPRRESARRNHPLARECDIVETLHMRLTLLQMTFGKHIERKHICFFPGEVSIQQYILKMKRAILFFCFGKDHFLTSLSRLQIFKMCLFEPNLLVKVETDEML